MRKVGVEISQVKKLVELVEKYDLEEISVQENDLSVTVKGKGAPAASHAASEPPAGKPQQPEVEVFTEPIATTPHMPVFEGDIVDIVAPLVGVFYRSPSPDAAPFVEVGSIIEVGSEVGLIEAMKVFSPIPSEVAGEIVDIPAENSKLVREGDVLVRVRRLEEQVGN